MNIPNKRRLKAGFFIAIFTLLAFSSFAWAQSVLKGEIVATLSKGNFFENVVATEDGSLFVTNYIGRAVYRYRPDDGLRLVAEIDGNPAGIERTPDGLVVSVHSRAIGSNSGVSAANRIVELSLDGRVLDTFDIPGSVFLNGIEALGNDRYLVAESSLGIIYEFTPSTNASAVWLDDDRLKVIDQTKSQPAVNGLKLTDGLLWITNSQRGLLLTVPADDPRPDAIKIQAKDVVLDDFVIDEAGLIYATTHTDKLLRFTPDMQMEVFATGEQNIAGGTAAVIVRENGRPALYVVGDGGFYEGKDLKPAAIVRIWLSSE